MNSTPEPSFDVGHERQGHGIEVHDLSAGEAAARRDEWNDLLARALEPNVLHAPEVLLPALETFAPDARLLVARRRDAGVDRLVALVPLWKPRLGFGLCRRLPTVFSNQYMPLGSPLIDADRPEETFVAVLAAIADRDPGIVFGHLALDGALFAALERAVAITGHHATVVEHHRRAVLRGDAPGRDFLHDHFGHKRRKEWRRLWRRLCDTGDVRSAVIRGPAARSAFADFVVLEASGWKGQRRTALVQDPKILRFAERVVAELAETGRVVVDRIDRAGQPVAMLVSFGAEGHWVTWKTAYDEAFAAFSPGLQVMLHCTQRLLDEDDLVTADSLAVENHPMMNHLWRDRRTIGTVVVAFPAPLHLPLSVRMATAELLLHHRLHRVARRLRDRFVG